MPYVPATVTKTGLHMQECLIFTHAYFHTVKNYVGLSD